MITLSTYLEEYAKYLDRYAVHLTEYSNDIRTILATCPGEGNEPCLINRAKEKWPIGDLRVKNLLELENEKNRKRTEEENGCLLSISADPAAGGSSIGDFFNELPVPPLPNMAPKPPTPTDKSKPPTSTDRSK
jgi:hypothetical protein